MPRKRWPRFVAVVLAVLLLVSGWILMQVRQAGSEGPNYRDDDYFSRLHFLWQESDWDNGRAPEATLDGGWLEWLTATRNPLMAQGPYLVAYPANASEKPGPSMLILPGGGYRFRSELFEGLNIARWLNKHGITGFVLNYRLGRHPEPVLDAMSAISYLRIHSQELGVAPGQLGVIGFSAGGHLAATLATQFDNDILKKQLPERYQNVSAKPDFAVLAYPVITMREPHVHMGSRTNLLGKNPTPALIDQLSAETQVTPATPPTFLWAPKTDAVVPYQNAQLFAQALEAHSVPYELHLFPQGNHGSALAGREPFAKEWPKLMLSWLSELDQVENERK